MKVKLLDPPDGLVVARGSNYGGNDCEFVLGDDDQVYFQARGNGERTWPVLTAKHFGGLYMRGTAIAPTSAGYRQNTHS